MWTDGWRLGSIGDLGVFSLTSINSSPAVLDYRFPGAPTARSFKDPVFGPLEHLPPVVGVPCGIPTDSEKRVYTGWDIILEKRGLQR